MDEKEKRTIEGSVHSIVYRNEESGYAVFRLRPEGAAEKGEEPFVLAGCAPYIAPGEQIRAEGRFVVHPVHGRQFRIEEIERKLPAEEAAILDYLSSGVIKGVGPAIAGKIVGRFGAEALDVLQNAPHKLVDIKGITGARAKQIGETVRRQIGVRSLMEFLTTYRLAPQIALRLYKRYGEYGAQTVRRNPYLLVDEYYGVSFHDADDMALGLGFEALSPQRMEAASLFELEYNLNQGHTYIPRDKLADATVALLNVPPEEYELWQGAVYDAIRRLIQREEIILDSRIDEDACYLSRIYRAERDVAERLLQMASKRLLPPRGITKMVDELEQETAIDFAAEQRRAVLMSARSRVMLLTGGPGTGKTTTIRAMLNLFNRMGLKTALAAPTGRAAKRMTELCGEEATTIHRLLDMEYSRELGTFSFVHDSSHPMDYDAVVVDETSMMDITLMQALLDALPWECRLVLVGDPDQLPSVGPGNVLSDMIASGAIDTVELVDIFRQASQSTIITNAHAINHGKMPDLKAHMGSDFFFLSCEDGEQLCRTVVELCRDRLPGKMGIDPSRIQVLSPTRAQETGTIALNRALREALNPPAEGKKELRIGGFSFREGDKVMQIRNNYDLAWTKGKELGMGVYNGDIGVVREIDLHGGRMLVAMDDRIVEYTAEIMDELEPAYALTVHKAQGSEYDAVILAALKGAPMLFNRRVLYTAITRAKSLMVIVGSASVVDRMVRNNKVGGRYSGLRTRLRQQL